MSYDDKDIDILLERWYDTKEKLSELENKLEKYKKYAEKIMNENDLQTLSNSKYTLARRNMSRNILSKDDVPFDVWNRYSRNINYNMFTIKKNKNKKES